MSVRIIVLAQEGHPWWEGKILTLSRVPCIGECVQVHNQEPVQRVTRVLHHQDINKRTVASITVIAD